MKYLACAMKLAIALIGLYMMYSFPDMTKPPFVSGLALVLVGMYLELFGKACSCACDCSKKKPKKDKKKKKDKKGKKDKYEGNY